MNNMLYPSKDSEAKGIHLIFFYIYLFLHLKANRVLPEAEEEDKGADYVLEISSNLSYCGSCTYTYDIVFLYENESWKLGNGQHIFKITLVARLCSWLRTSGP